ncbi:hypothetical protein LNP20_28750 [Klebsiella pneumoniae subsp. pneumoniae]|nr:hypothetical protein [Klebsiella pneumoniae subsp. pneumoniae]
MDRESGNFSQQSCERLAETWIIVAKKRKGHPAGGPLLLWRGVEMVEIPPP